MSTLHSCGCVSGQRTWLVLGDLMAPFPFLSTGNDHTVDRGTWAPSSNLASASLGCMCPGCGPLGSRVALKSGEKTPRAVDNGMHTVGRQAPDECGPSVSDERGRRASRRPGPPARGERRPRVSGPLMAISAEILRPDSGGSEWQGLPVARPGTSTVPRPQAHHGHHSCLLSRMADGFPTSWGQS